MVASQTTGIRNNKYLGTAIGLYMNYFVLGVQMIVLAQNMPEFATMWGTTEAGVMGVIAMTGIGKVIGQLFSGALSDKFGRKPVALAGMVGFMLFFGILPFNTSLLVANIIVFVAGASTSCWDGSIYPALIEIFPDNASSASAMVKGFISISGMLFPFLLIFLDSNGFWFGWSSVLLFVIILINFIYLWNAKFPDQEVEKSNVKDDNAPEEGLDCVKKPNFKIEGLTLVMYSFLCMSTFYLFQQVITRYGTQVVGMTENASKILMTYFTAGSLLGVFFSSFIMAKGFRNIAVLIIYSGLSAVATLSIYLAPTPITTSIGSFVIGLTAAGGVLQIGNTLLCQFFPKGKGKLTNAYYIATSFAAYVLPTIAGKLMEIDFTKVMLLDFAVAILGFILMVFLGARYKKLVGVKSIFSMDNN